MIKTVKVKLHNPSNYKQAILDRVFLRWTLAADVTLRWAEEHLDAFHDCKDQRDRYRANLIAGVLDRRLRPTIKHFGLHSSLEAALWRDIGKAIASYFERLKEDPNTGFPSVRRAKPNPARYEAALEALATLALEGTAPGTGAGAKEGGKLEGTAPGTGAGAKEEGQGKKGRREEGEKGKREQGNKGTRGGGRGEGGRS